MNRTANKLYVLKYYSRYVIYISIYIDFQEQYIYSLGIDQYGSSQYRYIFLADTFGYIYIWIDISATDTDCKNVDICRYRYLADTDIADIYLADNWYQCGDTDISVSAKYIGKPIYRSIPNTVYAYYKRTVYMIIFKMNCQYMIFVKMYISRTVDIYDICLTRTVNNE